MTSEIIYEYAILRYVPDVEREEFLNIGLIMMSKRWRWMRAELLIDDEKARMICPRCDLQRLRTQSALFTRKDVPAANLPVEEKYRWLVAVKSAIIQTSPSHPGIIPAQDADLASQEAVKALLDERFDSLFSRLVK